MNRDGRRNGRQDVDDAVDASHQDGITTDPTGLLEDERSVVSV
jgi:hypothetical protein